MFHTLDILKVFNCFDDSFHVTDAEYLRDLLPKEVVLISTCILCIIRVNVNYSNLIISSSLRSLFSSNKLFVLLLKGVCFIIRMHFFCKILIVLMLFTFVKDQTGQPYNNFE